MKRFLSKLLILLLIGFFVPFIINAVVTIENPLTYDSFWDLLNAIINFLMWIAVPIASAAIVVSGFYFITAGGDPEKIRIATRMLVWPLIGLFTVLCAWAIIGIIKAVFNINL